MKEKIVLFFPKLEQHKDFHYMPISLLAAATNIKDADIVLIDARININYLDLLSYELFNANKLMISLLTGYQLAMAYDVSKWCKIMFPKVKIIWGGAHVTALPEQTLQSKYVDEIIVGDTDDGTNPLPFHLIDIKNYINPATKRFVYISSYGCVGSCSFCATVPKKKLLFIPLWRVKEDIENLMSMYKFKEAVFFDATIFTQEIRALYISALMQEHKLDWICDARADEIIKTNKKILDCIMHSKLKRITIGLETGCQRIAEKMKKGKNHLENFKKCVEIMKEYDVQMCSGVIFGIPGETIDHIKETINYIDEIIRINPNFRLSTTFYKPLPGTLMAKECEQYGYAPPQTLEEWSKHGEGSHYNYNQWNDVPWIENQNEYKKIYDEFKLKHLDLFV